MKRLDAIFRNFRLLLAQVSKQLETTRRLLGERSDELTRGLQSSENYIDTQRAMIENDCYSLIARNQEADDETISVLRAVIIVVGNLERISDYSINTVRQARQLQDAQRLRRYEYGEYFELLATGVSLVEEALIGRDSEMAMRICRIEEKLDDLYRNDYLEILHELRDSSEPEPLVLSMFCLHYLERMGDALLNIGEAILSAAVGERLKVQQYGMLDKALSSGGGLARPIDDVDVSSIWGTKSGVRVGAAQATTPEGPRRVLFKEGDPEKLRKELASLERWEEIAPGLAPRVVEYQQKETEAALLLQFLEGRTFQDVLMNSEPPMCEQARTRIEQTVEGIWDRTRESELINAHYARQMSDRLEDVFRLHPRFRGSDVQIGAVKAPSFASLLSQARGLDEELPAPFSVFIHGDFNIDNILYDSLTDRLHFIDVYRSRRQDYVQDVSVFLVSIFRLPVAEPRIRANLNRAARGFMSFARRFARERDDATFEARLGLGLARSFTTSTRFETDSDFANVMRQRATLLLETLLEHHGSPWADYHVPDDVLIY
ncbi:MAG: phosphotransferase [Phycisphaerales bacterium]|nr:phosphotransferase [Phycisphaerales bacterium]